MDKKKAINKEKIEQAILHLQGYFSVVDNHLYEHYSKEGLEKELGEITDSIIYLESLL